MAAANCAVTLTLKLLRLHRRIGCSSFSNVPHKSEHIEGLTAQISFFMFGGNAAMPLALPIKCEMLHPCSHLSFKAVQTLIEALPLFRR